MILSSALALLATRAISADARDARLQKKLTWLAGKTGSGLLGITVVDVERHQRIHINAGHSYPMMSVFKAPVAAAVLAQVDAGQLTLDQRVTIRRSDVVGGSAVPSIGAQFDGEHMDFTVDRLLAAAVSESDNTAVDALLRLVGGPHAVTEFLREHHIADMRVDLGEAGISGIFQGTQDGRVIPEAETDEAETERLRQGYRAYSQDPRNRTTPDAAAEFLEKLSSGHLLTATSTRRLLDLMSAQTKPVRIRAGLPADVRFADKCGTSYSLEGETAAFNDIGIMAWPDGHTVIVAALMAGSHADEGARDKLFAEIGRSVAEFGSRERPKL